jgi:hypothetical protein
MSGSSTRVPTPPLAKDSIRGRVRLRSTGRIRDRSQEEESRRSAKGYAMGFAKGKSLGKGKGLGKGKSLGKGFDNGFDYVSFDYVSFEKGLGKGYKDSIDKGFLTSPGYAFAPHGGKGQGSG